MSLSSMIHHIFWRKYTTILKGQVSKLERTMRCGNLLFYFTLAIHCYLSEWLPGYHKNMWICQYFQGGGERVDTGTNLAPHNSISRMSIYILLQSNIMRPTPTRSFIFQDTWYHQMSHSYFYPINFNYIRRREYHHLFSGILFFQYYKNGV